MTFDDLSATAPSPLPSGHESESRGVSSSAPRGSAISPLSWHEAGHALVGRYLGFEIARVTIIPSTHYAGCVLAPEANPDASPEAQIEATEALCVQAARLMPEPGNDLSSAAPWFVHVASRCTELAAGRIAEMRASHAGAARPWLENASDTALAKIYARSICHTEAAVAAYLDYCRIEAGEILGRHWPIVQALASRLESQGTLDGVMWMRSSPRPSVKPLWPRRRPGESECGRQKNAPRSF